MKTFLRGTVAAIATLSMAGTAVAATHQTTNQRHYAIDLQVLGGPVLRDTNPDAATAGFYDSLLPLGNTVGFGTRYTASTTASDDTENATPTVSNAFTLTGSVNKDCSFYAGNDNSARDIDFGVIGVRTGNNENVNQAFDMAGPATAEIETLTAGCNFNNEVEIVKSSADGLINNSATDYDSDEFQANIPYRVTARWTGVEAGSGAAAGEDQVLVVGLNEADDSILQGAWRSDMTISFNAPVAAKALVAGRYTGTTRLTLRAL